MDQPIPSALSSNSANRGGESGYALLLVFALAAAVALEFYLTLPRQSFEMRRTREQVLIQRGEQYKRAIQLFVRRNRRYPISVEELEDTMGQRTLRHRYADPMTETGQWRWVHVGPGGILIDSLVNETAEKGDLGLGNSQPAATPASQFTGSAMPTGQPIAGVASLADVRSILIYNGREKYNEWEFTYDILKDLTMTGGFGIGGTPGSQGAGAAPGVQANPGTPVAGQGSAPAP
jgi:hypothetical protein